MYLAAGDLRPPAAAAARRELPFFREADHLAVAWLLTTAAMAGDFDEAVELARRLPAVVARGRTGRRSAGSRSPRRRRRWRTASVATTRPGASGSASSPRCGAS